MCIICELRKAVAADDAKKMEVIGTVSAKLLADFNAYHVAKANTELDVDQLILDSRRALINGQITEKEAEDRQITVDMRVEANEANFDAQHDALWERVYEEMGLVGKERNRGYSIDKESGEVSTKKRRLHVVGGGLH